MSTIDDDSPPQDPTHPRSSGLPSVGETIDGKFKIISLLGAGAVGTVFKAEQILINRELAIKFLHIHLANDETSTARFKREAQLACQLRNPYVVHVIDFGFWKSVPYLVMELAHGKSLRDSFLAGFRFSSYEAKIFLQQAGQAIAEAHSLGIIHRDLKPENITVQGSGSNLSFRVLDFGLAKSISALPDSLQTPIVGGTRQGMFFGTPAYASPEQALAKELTPATDIYSLGIILYEGVTGEIPYHADSEMEVLIKHVSEKVPQLNEYRQSLGFKLTQLIEKCLAKDPSQRFKDGSELLSAANLLPAKDTTIAPLNLKHALLGILAVIGLLYGVIALFDRPDSKSDKKDLNNYQDPAIDTPTTSIPPNNIATKNSPKTPLPIDMVRPIQTKFSQSLPTLAPHVALPTVSVATPVPNIFATSFASPTQALPQETATSLSVPTFASEVFKERSINPKINASDAESINLAMQAFARGRFSETVQRLEPIVRTNPRNVSALTTIGLSYEHLGLCHDAEPPLRQAANISTKVSVLHYYLARVQAQCNKPVEAIAELSRAIQLNSSLRSRAAADPLFANLSRRPEFQALIKSNKRGRTSTSEIGQQVGRALNNVWRNLGW